MGFQESLSNVTLDKSIELSENKPALEYSFPIIGHAYHDYKNLWSCIKFENGNPIRVSCNDYY